MRGTRISHSSSSGRAMVRRTPRKKSLRLTMRSPAALASTTSAPRASSGVIVSLQQLQRFLHADRLQIGVPHPRVLASHRRCTMLRPACHFEEIRDHHVLATEREVIGIRQLLDALDLLPVRLEDGCEGEEAKI